MAKYILLNCETNMKTWALRKVFCQPQQLYDIETAAW